MPGKLIIARHHESTWNKLGMWTGRMDVDLTEYGISKAMSMGELIKNIRIHHGFTSMQTRTIQTINCILNTCESKDVPVIHSDALNERDYGDYTGKNKFEVKELVGDEEFLKIRRSWDYKIPNGETLKDVYLRAVPFYKENIIPLLNKNENVLIVGHGNSIRALMKYIENIDDEKILELEIPFGAVFVYDVDEQGQFTNREIFITESNVNA